MYGNIKTTLSILIVAIFVGVTLAFPPDLQMKFMTDIMPKCAKENGLKQSAVLAFASGNIPSTRANKCFTKCVFVKFALMDSNGKISTNNDFIKKVQSNNAKEAKYYVDCVNNKNNIKSDVCETAYAVMQCVNNKL